MKKGKGGRLGLRLLLIGLITLIGGFWSAINFAYGAPEYGKVIGIAQVYQLAGANQISDARLLDEDAQLVGTTCSVPVTAAAAGAAGAGLSSVEPLACAGKAVKFQAVYPRSDVATQQLIDRILQSGAPVSIDKQTDKAVAKLVVTFVFPLLMLANLFGIIFMSRGADSSMADIAGFGTIRRKRQRRQLQGTGLTFENVAGAEESVIEMREVVEYLQEPEKFKAYGAAVPKGVLLFGPPGCGKTLLAKAVAGESGVPFYAMSGAEFVESLVGVGAARVRDLFRQVREVAPAIVFIDEIDAVGRKREGEGATGGEREQTVNQLLIEIDGFDSGSGIVVMGATNRPDILDPALLRPGRFDRHITLTPPDIHGRKEILELHAANKPVDDNVDFDFIARRTPGFTGADLANVLNEAALLTIRQREGAKIQTADLMEAVQRVLHGPQRRGHLMSDLERKRVAYHESGHAVTAAALGKKDNVQRVSIVTRGRGLGQAMISPEDERVLLTRSDLAADLVIAMGGSAAEKAFFGESSTTAEQDLDQANDLARMMIGRYGMSDRIGALRLMNASQDGFLYGGAGTVAQVSSESMAAFDQEVKLMLDWAERRAAKIVTDFRSHLETMARLLLEEETLEGQALERIMEQVRNDVQLFGMEELVPTANGKKKEEPTRSRRQ